MFSIIAGVLALIAFIPYIHAIIMGTTKPSKATWLIWATLDTITILGMFAKGAVNGQIAAAVAGAWIVAVLALKYGNPGWKIIDKICLSGAVLAVILLIFGNPVLGIISSLSGVLIGSIPTFISSWEDPSREDRMAWGLYFLSCIAALIGIPQWTWADAAQPLVFLIIESIMIYILFFRPLWSVARVVK